MFQVWDFLCDFSFFVVSGYAEVPGKFLRSGSDQPEVAKSAKITFWHFWDTFPALTPRKISEKSRLSKIATIHCGITYKGSVCQLWCPTELTGSQELLPTIFFEVVQFGCEVVQFCSVYKGIPLYFPCKLHCPGFQR